MTAPAPYLVDPPPEYVVPVTKGTDLDFTLRRVDADGNPQDWAADLYISIDIDKLAPTQINAAVTNELAVFHIESITLDQTKNGMKWRVVASVPGTPTNEVAVAVGTFERHDG